MTGPDKLRFLGVEHRIADKADWNRGDWPKLWLYNAHYFDDLVAIDADARTDWHRAFLVRWMAENPPGQGNGWEPYPTSLRICNWLKWLIAGNSPVPGMLHSLAIQVRWLNKRLEHHLLGNHLWANAKALAFAGACFEGKEADAWWRRGLTLLKRELAEQVLLDGGHFERSPMYHAILTEDLLDLIQLANRIRAIPPEMLEEWTEVVVRMLDWAGVMAHPDGELSFFNDAAFGIAPALPMLRGYSSALGLPLPALPGDGARMLRESGYARLAVGPAVLITDVAPVGPNYLPGHAHADTLSFELSLSGRRVLVNGGTSTYQNDAERLRQRGTTAHNSLVVDGHDSSEVWAAFRVARRARVHDVTCEKVQGGVGLSAWHDGYRRLPGRVAHHRTWCLQFNGLEIIDTLDGHFCEAEANYLFAPGVLLDWRVEGGEGTLAPAIWNPRFGESVPTARLTIRFTGARCRVFFPWS